MTKVYEETRVVTIRLKDPKKVIHVEIVKYNNNGVVFIEKGIKCFVPYNNILIMENT